MIDEIIITIFVVTILSVLGCFYMAATSKWSLSPPKSNIDEDLEIEKMEDPLLQEFQQLELEVRQRDCLHKDWINFAVIGKGFQRCCRNCGKIEDLNIIMRNDICDARRVEKYWVKGPKSN
jgi:hypothetical protein